MLASSCRPGHPQPSPAAANFAWFTKFDALEMDEVEDMSFKEDKALVVLAWPALKPAVDAHYEKIGVANGRGYPTDDEEAALWRAWTHLLYPNKHIMISAPFAALYAQVVSDVTAVRCSTCTNVKPRGHSIHPQSTCVCVCVCVCNGGGGTRREK